MNGCCWRELLSMQTWWVCVYVLPRWPHDFVHFFFWRFALFLACCFPVRSFHAETDDSADTPAAMMANNGICSSHYLVRRMHRSLPTLSLSLTLAGPSAMSHVVSLCPHWPGVLLTILFIRYLSDLKYIWALIFFSHPAAPENC